MQIIDDLLDALHAPRGGLGGRLLCGRFDLAAQIDRVRIGVDGHALERAPVLGDEPVLHGAADDLVVDVGSERATGERTATERDTQHEHGKTPLAQRHQRKEVQVRRQELEEAHGPPRALANQTQAAAGRIAARSFSRRSTLCQSTFRKNASMYCAFSVTL